MQELVEEGKIITYYFSTQNQFADLDTKPLGKHSHLAIIKLVNNFED